MNRGPAPPFNVALVVLLAFLVGACSAQAKRVDCEGRLEPINQPAPKVKGTQADEPAASTEKRDR